MDGRDTGGRYAHVSASTKRDPFRSGISPASTRSEAQKLAFAEYQAKEKALGFVASLFAVESRADRVRAARLITAGSCRGTGCIQEATVRGAVSPALFGMLLVVLVSLGSARKTLRAGVQELWGAPVLPTKT